MSHFRRCGKAATRKRRGHLTELAIDAEKNDPSAASWHLHWLGVALLHANKPDAESFFWQASNKKLSLGRPVNTFAGRQIGATLAGPQSKRIAGNSSDTYRKNIEDIIKKLNGDGGKNAEDHEEGLRLLGEKLGFLASRPGNPGTGTGTGPDVLWELPELNVVVAMEAKTQKESPKAYKKNKHIGKVLNDCEWLANNYGGHERRIMIIGPQCGVAPQASPPSDLRIVQMAEFIELAYRLANAAQSIAARIDSNRPAELAIEDALMYYGLLWPDSLDAFNYELAVDLQLDCEAEDEQSFENPTS